MDIKIGKIELSLTNNGTPKAIVYPEGSDFNNVAEGIELLGENDTLYLATRKNGETISIVEKGKWKNVVIPNEYVSALNSPNYDRIKLLFKRSMSSLNKAINGTRTELDLETTNVLISENINLFAKVQDMVFNELKEIDTPYIKQIVSDVKSKDNEKMNNAWAVINDLTHRNIYEISKDYKIVNNLDALKNKTKKQ